MPRGHLQCGCVIGLRDWVAARLYSLLETAKLVGVDPPHYIVEAVKAARIGHVLLPHDLLE